jgi:hypothetical protein
MEPSSVSMLDSQLDYVGEDDTQFFRRVHGRRLNTMNERYMLPVDDDEIKVFFLTGEIMHEHR